MKLEMTILDELHQFIYQNFLLYKNIEYNSSTDLIETGIITDNEFLELISFLEERFNIYFSDDELVIGYFNTIERITQIVNQKISGDRF